MKQRNKSIRGPLNESFREGFQKLFVISVLSFALIALSGCTSTATSQLKESPCKECTSKKAFYCNGVWLEEQPHVN